MYFELTEDLTHDFGIKEPENLPDDLLFVSGKPISPKVNSPFTFTTKADKRDHIPDFWNTAMPVMSKQFIEMLEEAGVNNFQKFPAVVKSIQTNTVYDDFYVINVIGKIACVHLEKSTYNEIFPGNYSFKELAIDKELIPENLLLFRLQESPSTIIIHQSVGAYIMDHDPDETLKGWDVYEIIQ